MRTLLTGFTSRPIQFGRLSFLLNRREDPGLKRNKGSKMKFTAIVECCKETGLYVGYVPGFPGAHAQGESLDELNEQLKEVISMLVEDGARPSIASEFVGVQQIQIS